MVLKAACELVALSSECPIVDFDCGDMDLNDFFNHDADKWQSQMLGNTYFFRHLETEKTVCAFTVSSDGLKAYTLPNSRRKKVNTFIPNEKSLQSYPAILIGRLGVASGFAGQGLGAQLMEFIKSWSIETYPDFFRFLLVDAYNQPVVLDYYQRNQFAFVFSTEEQEREYKKPGTADLLHTRFMFYDMIQWKDKLA
jgi:GNAT superfamily N-acetyltransferase